MKVINEWDGAPAQTPTQIIREWYAEHVREIYDNGIDDFEVDALMSALAPLFAAGPWRTDVENAPKDGSEVLLAWRDCIGEPHCESFHWDADDEVWINGDGGFIEDSGIRAFATINQPEIQG